MRSMLFFAIFVSACAAASPYETECSVLSDCPPGRHCETFLPGGACVGVACSAGEVLARGAWPGSPAQICLRTCLRNEDCRRGWTCVSLQEDSACIPRCDLMPDSFCGGYRCLSDGKCNQFCVRDADCADGYRCDQQTCVVSP